MRVLAVLGSRDPEGQTATAVRALLDGLESEGAETERIFLPGLSLESCRQCEEDGWGICHSEGRCVIDDDFEAVRKKIGDAGILVFAVPVYYSDLSETMKVFTDRLRRCSAPVKGRSGKNPYFKPAIGICVAGGGGGGAEQACVNLKKVLSTCGFECLDMIPVRRQNLPIKQKTLRVLGQWLNEHVASGEWERVIPRPPAVK